MYVRNIVKEQQMTTQIYQMELGAWGLADGTGEDTSRLTKKGDRNG